MENRTKTHGIVVFYAPDYSNKTIKEIGRTNVLSSWDALDIYAETPNPASQMIEWDENIPGDKEEQEAVLAKCIQDPVWLEHLFEQI